MKMFVNGMNTKKKHIYLFLRRAYTNTKQKVWYYEYHNEKEKDGKASFTVLKVKDKTHNWNEVTLTF